MHSGYKRLLLLVFLHCTTYLVMRKPISRNKALLAYALTKSGNLAKAKKLSSRSYELNQVVKYRDAVYNISLGNYSKAPDLPEATYEECGNGYTVKVRSYP